MKDGGSARPAEDATTAAIKEVDETNRVNQRGRDMAAPTFCRVESSELASRCVRQRRPALRLHHCTIADEDPKTGIADGRGEPQSTVAAQKTSPEFPTHF